MSKIELLITLVKEAVKKCYTDDKTLIERNMDDPKRLAENERGKRPDVILHKRMSNDDNLLILEFKNGINNLHQDNLINDDYDKLRAFTNLDGTYKYFLGMSVKLNVEEPMYVFFQNGQETAREDLSDE